MEGGKKIKIDSVQEKPMKVYLRILLTVYRQKKKKEARKGECGWAFLHSPKIPQCEE